MSETKSKRATVYFDPVLHKALRLKAAAVDRSLSDLVDEAVRGLLAEDADDLAALEERRGEPTESFESFVGALRADGLI